MSAEHVQELQRAVQRLAHDGCSLNDIKEAAAALALVEFINSAKGIKRRASVTSGLNRVTLDRLARTHSIHTDRGTGVTDEVIILFGQPYRLLPKYSGPSLIKGE